MEGKEVYVKKLRLFYIFISFRCTAFVNILSYSPLHLIETRRTRNFMKNQKQLARPGIVPNT